LLGGDWYFRSLHGTIAPAVTTQTHDDGFHEIQLNGKQLVFLFMAATVVSVVIFLCGVLVGRGVRTDRGIVAEAAAPPALTSRVSQPTESSDGGRDVASPPAELSYVKRLEDPEPHSEELKPAPASPVAVPPAGEPAPKAVPPPTAPPPKPAPAATTSEPKAKVDPVPAAAAKPAPVVEQNAALTAKASTVKTPAVASPPAAEGRDWTVQVAAVNDRGEADVMVQRLSTKGYSAFVVAPTSGTPTIFRVRVGAFKTKREAENLAVKIQKEERYKPWVTR